MILVNLESSWLEMTFVSVIIWPVVGGPGMKQRGKLPLVFDPELSISSLLEKPNNMGVMVPLLLELDILVVTSSGMGLAPMNSTYDSKLAQ